MENPGLPEETARNATPVAEQEKRPTRSLKESVHHFLTRNIWSEKDGRNRDHIPPMPVWAGGLRVAQLVLATATLALTAYGIATIQQASGYRRITNWSGTEGYPYSWFLFSWTCVYLAWLGLAVTLLPIMYNCWVHLGIEILTLLLWLIAMALLASHSDELDSIDAFVGGLGPAFEAYYKDFIEVYARGFVVATYAATAVAVFNLVLFVITLVFFGRALHAHRMSGMATTRPRRLQGLSDPDQIVASPCTFGAEVPHPSRMAYFPPNQSDQPYSGQPPPGPSYDTNVGSQPASWMSSHPMPYPHHQPQNRLPSTPSQPGAAHADSGSYVPSGPSSFGAPGSVWPQHSYAMYEQQVHIAPQHTGPSQRGPGSPPPYPMVVPVGGTKSDLRGVRETPPPPPNRTASSVARTYSGQPAELHNEDVGGRNMPAELPHDPLPRRPAAPDP
ncbi:hypothetical protein SODALDRAFT_180392 [Sodiomyces alkalinus F11]|uniref:MARVEL domain-containing protein n=1 Tax=Sodiomyces alkalinus (strain CBS 110278 / VKM F-3762 / F11) TaxID=1314773 RepID=A0A3N2PUP1_SODAK|nr:hypothetical protein SODALDRAFT_180392 [Sodiomyces alkalinus F11]ROT38056.1 hypothetical protein SODALDRAFT_180392 [Sodiomyces alkalinus F11]